ncbi:MAG: hypothetical protein EBX41_08030 [Chitinophagia bacterium]|nr:hypothetical protein [Chitinophagia bacterium]
MCSFLVTNKSNFSLDNISLKRMQQRGPTGTTITRVKNNTIVHSLLHITGETTFQPFIKNNDFMVFNGEIYNYDKSYSSDGCFLFDNLKKLNQLEGEYSGMFFSNNNCFIFSDLFGTKPLFYAFENNEYGISTFYNSLKSLGFKNIKKALNNAILDLQNDFSFKIHDLNLNQNVDNFDLWESNFLESVLKRYKKHKTFLCISSGYDSGAIGLACKILDLDVKMYCIKNNENIKVLEDRNSFLGNIKFIDVDAYKINKNLNLINYYGDDYIFNNYNYKTDSASIGLSIICEQAKKDDLNVMLSGSGSDEIMSDYGIEGRDIFGDSLLKGIFPEDLNSVFPWKNFFQGRQEQYLFKEECVAGIHGIEGRYPFLDKRLVQSFLNLKSSLKNKSYKSPLAHFFDKYNFPYEKNIKRGFKCE